MKAVKTIHVSELFCYIYYMDKNKHMAYLPSKENVEIIEPIRRAEKVKPYADELHLWDIEEYIDDLDEFSEEEKLIMVKRLENFSGGSIYTGVMTCRGPEKCPYMPDCPFKPKFPEGKKCPVERALAVKWFGEYRASLGVDIGNRSEVSLLHAMISIELQIMRANALLSYEGMEQKVYKTSPDESMIVEHKEHSLLNTISKLNDQKIRIIKAFNATREGINAPAKKDPITELQKAMEKLGINK